MFGCKSTVTACSWNWRFAGGLVWYEVNRSEKFQHSADAGIRQKRRSRKRRRRGIWRGGIVSSVAKQIDTQYRNTMVTRTKLLIISTTVVIATDTKKINRREFCRQSNYCKISTNLLLMLSQGFNYEMRASAWTFGPNGPWVSRVICFPWLR